MRIVLVLLVVKNEKIWFFDVQMNDIPFVQLLHAFQGLEKDYECSMLAERLQEINRFEDRLVRSVLEKQGFLENLFFCFNKEIYVLFNFSDSFQNKLTAFSYIKYGCLFFVFELSVFSFLFCQLQDIVASIVHSLHQPYFWKSSLIYPPYLL